MNSDSIHRLRRFHRLKTSVAVQIERAADQPRREGDFGVGELVAALGATVGGGAEVVVAARAAAALEAAVPAADDDVDDQAGENGGEPEDGDGLAEVIIERVGEPAKFYG